jgi:hypothetical protein
MIILVLLVRVEYHRPYCHNLLTLLRSSVVSSCRQEIYFDRRLSDVKIIHTRTIFASIILGLSRYLELRIILY